MNLCTNPKLVALQGALLIVSGFLCTSAHAVTYLEEDGVVIFEVEEANVPNKWIVGTQTAGYTGSGYLEWNGEQRFGAGAAENGKITYRIRISNAGNYQFRWRNRINRGNENTEHNDAFLRLPTATNIADEYPIGNWTKVYMNQANTWSWNTGTKDHDWQVIRQHFTAGDHTIEISGRSPGHAIDRIALYKYDQVNFNVSRFDSKPVSRILNGGNSNGGDGGGNDNGDTSNSGDTQTQENVNAAVVEETLSEGICSDNRLTLSPKVDFYTQAELVQESESLRLDGSQRQTYLQYDLSGVSGIVNAELRYSITTDPGSGQIDIDQLAHSTWTSNTLASELPSIVASLATAEGNWASATRYSSELDAAMIESSASATQAVSLKLSMTPSSNDIIIASSRHTSVSAPLLILAGDEGFCTRYEQDSQEMANQSDNEPSTETDPVSGDNTAGEEPSNPTNGDSVTDSANEPSDADKDSSDSDSSAEPENDASVAAFSGFELLGLLVVGLGFLRRSRTPVN